MDKPDFDPTRDFEEIWDDLFKADVRDEDEIARPLVEDEGSQDELESLTTQTGEIFLNSIDPVTNNLTSFPKQVAKQKSDEVKHITPPNEAHKSPVINPFLVELDKEFQDEQVDTTMITTLSHGMFKPFNLSIKFGKV